MNLLNLKGLIAALGIGLLAGFTAGFYTEGRFVKADQLEAAATTRHETATDALTSVNSSVATEQKIATTSAQISTIRRLAATRIQKETPNEAHLRLECGGLDVGTVRLLNAARAGTAIDTAGGINGEGKAPSGIGLPELLDSDLEVVGLYLELAERHDSLVNYVETLIKRQAQ